MRPNANSGSCTLENATNAAPKKNLHFPPTNLLQQDYFTHHFHPHQQQQSQPQSQHHHHHHHQIQNHQLLNQHHHYRQQQQYFNPQPAGIPWLSQHNAAYNTLPPHASNTNKNIPIGRHQPLPFGSQSNSTLALIQNEPQRMQPPSQPSHLHQQQQHKYNQHIACMPPLKQQQHQPLQLIQKSFLHPFTGYTNTVNTSRPVPPSERLVAISSTTSSTQQLHPSTIFPKPPPPPIPATTTATVINQQRINECAGIPLISNATAHLTTAQRQRIQRKLSHSPAPSLQKLPTTAARIYIPQNSNVIGCSNISQLAVHAQGVPLLLHNQQDKPIATSKWSMTQNYSNTFPLTQSTKKSLSAFACASASSSGTAFTAKSTARTTLRHQNSAPAALSTRSIDNITKHAKQDTTMSFAEAPKDNDANGDTVLPRIIKPRKRRKKDRKSTTNAISLKLDTHSSVPKSEIDRKRQVAQQSLLMSKQKNLEFHQQHPQSFNPQLNDSGNNLNRFMEFCLREQQQQSAESKSISNTFNTNALQLDYRAENLKQSNGLKQIVQKPCDGAQDNLGVCLCRACDPLRSIWDYPLRRSLSDSSATSIRTQSATSNSSTSSSSASSSSESTSSSSTALTDIKDDLLPISTSITSTLDRDVGVIGSNRNVHDNHRVASKCFSATQSNGGGGKTLGNGCLSDSNDSGYGDILSGINIVDDFFTQNRYNLSAALTPLLEVNKNGLALDVSSTLPYRSTRSADLYEDSKTEALRPLLPATADALLSESIMEISRKLIETCGSDLLPNEFSESTAKRSLSTYSRCSSDFSNDSGIDSAAIVNCDELVFKFDNFNLMIDNVITNTTNRINAVNNTITTRDENLRVSVNTLADLLNFSAVKEVETITKTNNSERSLLNETRLNGSQQFDINNNNTKNEKEQQSLFEKQHQQQQQQQQQHNQQFINNCFDLVWPTTFEHCLKKTITKTLDMNETKKELNVLQPYSAIA